MKDKPSKKHGIRVNTSPPKKPQFNTTIHYPINKGKFLPPFTEIGEVNHFVLHYVRLEHFFSSLSTGALSMGDMTTFLGTDEKEGWFTKDEAKRQEEILKDKWVREDFEKGQKNLLSSVFAQCFYNSDKDKESNWTDINGIKELALKLSANVIEEALKNSPDAITYALSPIKYVDFENSRGLEIQGFSIPGPARLFRKDEFFSSEKEVRSMALLGHNYQHLLEGGRFNLKVNWDDLLQEVIVSSKIYYQYHQQIENALKKAGVACKVSISEVF